MNPFVKGRALVLGAWLPQFWTGDDGLNRGGR
jgi:hypothetical protein